MVNMYTTFRTGPRRLARSFPFKAHEYACYISIITMLELTTCYMQNNLDEFLVLHTLFSSLCDQQTTNMSLNYRLVLPTTITFSMIKECGKNMEATLTAKYSKTIFQCRYVLKLQRTSTFTGKHPRAMYSFIIGLIPYLSLLATHHMLIKNDIFHPFPESSVMLRAS